MKPLQRRNVFKSHLKFCLNRLRSHRELLDSGQEAPRPVPVIVCGWMKFLRIYMARRSRLDAAGRPSGGEHFICRAGTSPPNIAIEPPAPGPL
jgi:hypothetical protein